MPVRARKDRRRPVADATAWECVFSSEFDFFGDLRGAGVETDAYGRADKEEARQAWHRFGADFLSMFKESYRPWALGEFGEPS